MNKELGFVADKLIAQEVVFNLLLNALQQMYPEITAKIISDLDRVLKTSPIPTPGARANLVEMRKAISQHQPTPAAGH